VRACQSHPSSSRRKVLFVSKISRMISLLATFVMSRSASLSPADVRVFHLQFRCIHSVQPAFHQVTRGVCVTQLDHQPHLAILEVTWHGHNFSKWSCVPQSCFSRRVFLISLKKESGINLVSLSMAYTSIHSYFARFPTRASFRASAPCTHVQTSWPRLAIH